MLSAMAGSGSESNLKVTPEISTYSSSSGPNIAIVVGKEERVRPGMLP